MCKREAVDEHARKATNVDHNTNKLGTRIDVLFVQNSIQAITQAQVHGVWNEMTKSVVPLRKKIKESLTMQRMPTPCDRKSLAERISKEHFWGSTRTTWSVDS